MKKGINPQINISVIVYLTIFILYSSVVSSQNDYTIQGTLSNHRQDGKIITLIQFVPNDTLIAHVDTSQIMNASFSFTGKENLDDFALISFTNNDDSSIRFYVILEKGTISVTIDESGNPWIEGTPLNNFLCSFTDSIKIQNKIVETAWNKLKEEEIFEKDFTAIALDYLSFYKQIVKDNMTNMIGQKHFILFGDHFDDDDMYYDILSIADEITINHPKVRAEIARREQKENEREAKDSIDFRELPWDYIALNSGKKIENFQFLTPEGETKHLYDYIGKSNYLYIDFWASWCVPCIAEMPKLKELYEKHKDNGLEIIGISFDGSIMDWMRGLERIDVPWPQLSDLALNSSIKTAYNIRGIPFGLLVDQEGIIIGGGLLSRNFMLEYIISKLTPKEIMQQNSRVADF